MRRRRCSQCLLFVQYRETERRCCPPGKGHACLSVHQSATRTRTQTQNKCSSTSSTTTTTSSSSPPLLQTYVSKHVTSKSSVSPVFGENEKVFAWERERKQTAAGTVLLPVRGTTMGKRHGGVFLSPAGQGKGISRWAQGRAGATKACSICNTNSHPNQNCGGGTLWCGKG